MDDLDPHLQQPTRLRLMAIASAASELEYATLRDQLGVSDSVLPGVRQHATGRRAMAAHATALRKILDGAD